jgi:two-component system response regulator
MVALRILLVEDDHADAALVADAFADIGISDTVHHTDSGSAALAYLHGDGEDAGAPRPDLILLDLNMPRMSGHDVLAVIKSDEKLRTIPVIVFTTSGSPLDVTASYQGHANAYVTKPMDLDGFGTVITRIRQFFGETATRVPAPAPA